MAARCLLLVWVKSAKGIPQPRANVFQERGRCWGILPSGGAVLGIVSGHGGHRHRQDLRQPVLDGGDDLEEMKSGLSSQKGITMFRQNRTIPALRLKHRSGSCGTASALPKCSIMTGCGTRIVLRGQKPLALCDRCPCFGSLFPPLAALTFAASSIICTFGLASAAPRSPYRHLELCGIALIVRIVRQGSEQQISSSTSAPFQISNFIISGLGPITPPPRSNAYPHGSALRSRFRSR